MPTLVLLRHGESEWNLANRFTGWWDIDLSEGGVAEARSAGRLLASEGIESDVTYTSLLTRAIRTATIALEEMDQNWVPVIKSWRLNERHYGALTGLDKAETRERYGDEQFMRWRRSFDDPPPPMEAGSALDVSRDRRYARLSADVVPTTECLSEVVVRMRPLWQDSIAPRLLAGESVLVVAHGNSVRAMVKSLDSISDDEIAGLEIPTGVPIVYQLDRQLRPDSKQELGDPAEIAAATEAVRRQGKA